MPRALNKLNVKQAAALADPGIYGDGGGLYLRISPNASRTRSWVFIYTLGPRRREMVLGSPLTMTLAQARAARDAARALVDAKVDPIDARNAPVAAAPAPEAKPTFGTVADTLVDGLEEGWKNDKHKQQWRNTLRTYGEPIWSRPIDTIETADVLAILKPIWLAKAETATRVRGRIEKVLDSAAALGHRDPDKPNPARWRGHLSLMLPSQKHVKKRHHPAMPYGEVGAFLRHLRAEHPTSVAAAAFEMLVLCANRTNEVRLARAKEFDLEAAVWTIPAEHMKAGVEHRVPLSPAAIELARARLRGVTDPDALVFPGRVRGKPLSVMALDMLLRRSEFDDYTVHGFRSSFRQWVDERTDFERELAEMCLAHTVGNEVERAYRRGDAIEKRRVIMAAWADYVAKSAD